MKALCLIFVWIALSCTTMAQNITNYQFSSTSGTFTALTGATGALPAWTGLMAAVSREPRRARAPGGITETWVDEAGGGLSGEGCPGARLMPFMNGTEPDYEAACAGSGLRWPWSGDKPAGEPGAAPEPGAAAQPGSAPQQEEKARDRWWKRWFGGDR